MKNKIYSLSGIRIFLAIHIILLHVKDFVSSDWINTIGLKAHLSTDFFFLLSGFILTYVYTNDSGEFKTSHRKFMWARFSKLYPLTFISLLISFPGYEIWHSGVMNVLDQIYGELFHKLFFAFSGYFFLDAWNPMYFASNAPTWSISALFFLYLCFPMLLSSLRGMSSNKLGSLLFTLIAVNFVIVTLDFFLTKDISIIYQKVIHKNPILKIPEFMIGMILCKIYLNREWEQIKLGVFKDKTLYFWAMILLVTLFLTSEYFPSVHEQRKIYTLPLAGLIFSLVIDKNLVTRFLSLGPVQRIGDVTLTVFLIHMPVLMMYNRLLRGINAAKVIREEKIPFTGFSEFFNTLLSINYEFHLTFGEFIGYIIVTLVLAWYIQLYFVDKLSDWLRLKVKMK